MQIVLAPPVGFRKAIPVVTKLKVVIRQDSKCTACGERLGNLEHTEFDHVPALQLRCWEPELKDTVPAANDPEFIEAKHTDCHKAKTTGRQGDSKLSIRGGDIQEIAKARRIAKKEQDFRQRILAKSTGEEVPEKKQKYRWPKRSFGRGRKNETGSSGNKKGSGSASGE